MNYDDEVLEKILKKIDSMTESDLISLKTKAQEISEIYSSVVVESEFFDILSTVNFEQINITGSIAPFDIRVSEYKIVDANASYESEGDITCNLAA